MKTNYLLLLLFVLFVSSCSNETDINNPDLSPVSATIDVPEIRMKVEYNEGRLVFENQSSFEAAVKALEDSKANQLYSQFESAIKEDSYAVAVIEESHPRKGSDFYSLYDHFSDAMNEAEMFYDTEESYNQFKEKYESLFFAEQPEDYSAYLPVSNKSIAKLLNEKGEVEIAGEVKDLRDITSYQQLVELGFIPKDEELIVTRASNQNGLDEVRCNDRKLWVKVWTRPGTHPGVMQDIVVEVCFRKKGFLGAWYNYSSETSLGWAAGAPWTGTWHKSGNSSHDYLFARVYQNGKPLPMAGTMWVQFRGFGDKCGGTKYNFNVNI